MSEITPVRGAQDVPSTRRDAARNRSRLLAAADELFCTVGLDVTREEVARRAGVGVGTVYRHFPSKDHLVDALVTHQFDALVELARVAAEDPDGWRGLTGFLEASCRAQLDHRGLRAALGMALAPTSRMGEAQRSIGALVSQMVDAARRQGSLRDDVDVEDVAAVHVALAAVMEAAGDRAPQRYRRHLDLLLAGMRAAGPVGDRTG